MKRGVGDDIVEGTVGFLRNILNRFLSIIFGLASMSLSHWLLISPAYLQCHWIRGISLNNVNILPADFSSNLNLNGGFVADETEDGIRWVLGELADELELDNGVCILVYILR